MNRRQTKKELKKALAAAKGPSNPSIQEAFDVLAEDLAKTGEITFFISPIFGQGIAGLKRFELSNTKGYSFVSKPVMET